MMLSLRAGALALVAVSSSAQAPSSPPKPAAWERAVGASFENKGVAQIEPLNNRWILNVMCGETHATYIDDTKMDLSRYANTYVRVRYHYVERTLVDPRCFRAPCPPVTERLVALDRVTPLSITPARAAEISRSCKSPQ